MHHTDIELLVASRAGDADAFGRLVRRYQSLAWAVALGATGDPAVSEDIAQEAFVTAWTELPRLREPDKFPAWLCGMVRNLARYARRHQRRHAPGAPVADDARQHLAGLPCPEPSPLDQVISRQQHGVLRDALDAIPERYRLPLLLFYSEHQSLEQVARCLDLSEQTVKQRLCRGRKYLKRSVEQRLARAVAASAPKAGLGAAVLAAISIPGGRASAATLSSVPWPWLAMFARSAAVAMTSAVAVTAIVIAGLAVSAPPGPALPQVPGASYHAAPQIPELPGTSSTPLSIPQRVLTVAPPAPPEATGSPRVPGPSYKAQKARTAAARPRVPGATATRASTAATPAATPAAAIIIEHGPSSAVPIVLEHGPSLVTRATATPGPSLSRHDLGALPLPSLTASRHNQGLPIEPPDLRDRIQAPDL